MDSYILITIGGIFNLTFAIFHLFFWKLFDWRNDLKSLSSINQNVMQILNLCLTFVFLVFAYISLFHTDELLSTALGTTLLALIAIFWFLRALEQIYFFGLKTLVSTLFFVAFLLGTALYALPLVI